MDKNITRRAFLLGSVSTAVLFGAGVSNTYTFDAVQLGKPGKRIIYVDCEGATSISIGGIEMRKIATGRFVWPGGHHTLEINPPDTAIPPMSA